MGETLSSTDQSPKLINFTFYLYQTCFEIFSIFNSSNVIGKKSNFLLKYIPNSNLIKFWGKLSISWLKNENKSLFILVLSFEFKITH